MLFLTSCHHPQPIYCVSELQGLAGGHSGVLCVCCNIQLRERRGSFILFALSMVPSLPYQGFHLENTRAVAECKGCNICTLNEKRPQVVICHVVAAGCTLRTGSWNICRSPEGPSPLVLPPGHHIHLHLTATLPWLVAPAGFSLLHGQSTCPPQRAPPPPVWTTRRFERRKNSINIQAFHFSANAVTSSLLRYFVNACQHLQLVVKFWNLSPKRSVIFLLV